MARIHRLGYGKARKFPRNRIFLACFLLLPLDVLSEIACEEVMMKIHHQSFRGRCLFCGTKTRSREILPPPAKEIVPEGLNRLSPTGGKSPTNGIGTGSSKSLPSQRIQGNISPSPREMGPRKEPQWAAPVRVAEECRPVGSPVIEDIYDDCPKARFYITLFSSFFILPMLFFIFGWQLLFIGIGLEALFFSFYLPEEQVKWHGLRDVQVEYSNLMALVSPGNRDYFNMLLGSALTALFALRDKAFKAQSQIFGESLEEFDYRIQSVRFRSQKIDDPDLAAMYQAQLRDLQENREKLKQISSLLEKFETNKNCMVESIKLMKNRILLSETFGDNTDETQVQDDLKSLHYVYQRVNHSHWQGNPAESAREVGQDDERPVNLTPQVIQLRAR